MLMLYGYEFADKRVHDNVREYCLNENVDEDYLRTLLYKSLSSTWALLSRFSFSRNKRTQKCMVNY